MANYEYKCIQDECEKCNETVEKGDNINVIFNDYGSFKKKRRI